MVHQQSGELLIQLHRQVVVNDTIRYMYNKDMSQEMLITIDNTHPSECLPVTEAHIVIYISHGAAWTPLFCFPVAHHIHKGAVDLFQPARIGF